VFETIAQANGSITEKLSEVPGKVTEEELFEVI
jgi:hypothetical protein